MATQLSPVDRERRVIVRAGLFVGLGLLLAGIVVFLIGKERNLFEKAVIYRGAFENVDGLALDSPVRLGGLQAGKVSKISFAPDLGDKRIIVSMEIGSKFRERIRKDSIARVTSRGVLGDKAIDVSLGSPDKPVIEDGEIETGTSGDLSSIIKASAEIIDNAVNITRDLRSGVSVYTSPDILKDVVGVVKSARSIMEEVETGRGLLHTVVYDKSTSDDFKLLVREASASAVRFDSALNKVDALLGEVKTGDGALHALVYDAKISGAVNDLGTAASELSSLITAAKTNKEGAVYQLVYGNAQNMLGDLGAAASDIKSLTSKVKSGQGSLGGIINDPTVYEDLKEILGNVKRNRVLRELVRYSISNGDAADGAGKVEEKKK